MKSNRPPRPLRLRQLEKTFYNLKLTLLCGFITILVLRGSIGAGKFGTPAQDFNGIKTHLRRVHIIHRKEEPSLLVAEVKPEHHKSINELIPKISDWNQQRQQWLNSHPPAAIARPSMLLITGSQPSPCHNPAGDHYLLKSIKNKIDYCRIHGIQIFYNLAHLDPEMSGFWSKLPLLKKLMLSHPDIEWFWWMDSDAMFTDMAFELPMEKYKNHNLVLHGWDEAIYNNKDWVGLNTGSFLIRNCQWSLDLLDAWAPMGPKGKVREEAGRLLSKSLKGRPDFEADDQSALVYLLITQREKWGEKVYLESSFYLHGYWVILVEKYEEMMEKYHPGLGDDRWPFVTHFVGCKPCGSLSYYPVEKCLKHMERAFNFADNQVLELYGYKHLSLETPNVKKIRNDTDTPILQLKQDLHSA